MLDTIIIGGGFSGIAAARILHKTNKSFIVLEARERLGGRVYTKRFENGQYLDFGGQWIGPTQDRMYALCKEYGVDYYETYNEGYNILDFGQKVRKYKGLIPKIDILSLLNLDWLLKKMERMAKSISASNPWSHPQAEAYDNMLLSDFIKKNCLTQASHKVITYGLETVFACELNTISLLHALFYIKSGHNLNSLISIKDGAQQHRIVGGMQTLVDKMAAKFLSQIHFNHPVQSIQQDQNSVKVSGDGFEFEAKNLIIAIPPPLAAEIKFTPELTSQKSQIINRISMGKVGKCFMVYDKPFWRDKNFSGQALADEHSPFQTLFDSSPKNGEYGVILGFAIADRAEEFFKKTLEQRKHAMLQKLVDYFGEDAKNPTAYHDFTMTDETWSRGCYAGLYPVGGWTAFQDAYSKPEDRFFWAGTEASDVWFGYIEGAVRAGEKAAQMTIGNPS
ncbi:FAD-dependent oxidoreductase [Aquiflexum sp. TKW24L]|uniref:flavin monoamine oxidase family protein n=1 Tax=Aquiflexum sp. TKW24L TaxID=2942212 RepID=UPI0020BE7B47|nr:FAD-dependent oxidoreductase [Aquiflexum sp. TKW24L]MCL6259038.1 FAD-dependent oxidoreductase [Aquiflexum sp. TKW24L]